MELYCYNIKKLIDPSNASIVNYIFAQYDKIEESSDRSGKVLVQVMNDGIQDRIRVDTSETRFNSEIDIQFPINLKTQGSKYLVDHLEHNKVHSIGLLVKYNLFFNIKFVI